VKPISSWSIWACVGTVLSATGYQAAGLAAGIVALPTTVWPTVTQMTMLRAEPVWR
jgi:hypothetical protein